MRPSRAAKEKEDTGFYEPYNSLSRAFRAWLVAFGVGAPVLFLSRDSTIEALKQIQDAKYVMLAFMLGVLLQIGLAWLYKTAMWLAYLEETHSITNTSRRYRFADWFTNRYWIEALVDVTSVALYAYATIRVLLVIVRY